MDFIFRFPARDHARHALSEALRRPDRLAQRKLVSVPAVSRVVCRWGLRIRNAPCRLERPIHFIAVASLFYLVPATTAIFAWLLFDERLDALSIIGIVLCAAAVFIVNYRKA